MDEVANLMNSSVSNDNPEDLLKKVEDGARTISLLQEDVEATMRNDEGKYFYSIISLEILIQL